MPVDSPTVQILIRDAAANAGEKGRLLELAASKPALWMGLEENEVVDVLRLALEREGAGSFAGSLEIAELKQLIKEEIAARPLEIAELKQLIKEEIAARPSELAELRQLIKEEIAGLEEEIAGLKQEFTTQLQPLRESYQLMKTVNRIILFEQLAPTPSTASQASSSYRVEAATFYFANDSPYCMITKVANGTVKAGHIYRQGWPGGLLGMLGFRLHDPGNILFMVSAIESRFDRMDLIVLPMADNKFQVRVLNPRLLKSGQVIDKNLQFKHIDGRFLTWETDRAVAHPRRSACGFHALLAIERAETLNWIEPGSITVPEESWGSPAPYKKELVKRFLIDQQESLATLVFSDDGQPLDG